MRIDDRSLFVEPVRLTLGIILYNQREFAAQAVRGALQQSYSPLEIVLSDDASSDGTYEMLEQSIAGYVGPHEVILSRNEQNLGLAGNVNRVMELATGEIVLLAGGDDISMQHRVARAAEVLREEDDYMCVSFGTTRFEGSEVPMETGPHETGGLARHSWHDYLAKPSFHLNGSSRAFRRRAFDFFGPIGMDCPTEDSVMLLRCLLLGGALSTPEPQVHYRVHGGNLYASDNRYLIDFEAIHRQYERDLTVAAEHRLLGPDEMELLRSALQRRKEGIRRRNLRHQGRESPNKLTFFFRSIAGSELFGRRDKLRMLGSALRPSRSKKHS